MAHNRIDETNLLKIGMNEHNIATLRKIDTIIRDAVFVSGDLEKLALSLPDNTQELRSKINRLETLVLMQSNTSGNNSDSKNQELALLFTEVIARFSVIENRLNKLEAMLWVLTSP